MPNPNGISLKYPNTYDCAKSPFFAVAPKAKGQLATGNAPKPTDVFPFFHEVCAKELQRKKEGKE
jgi:hypothetical protein